MLSPKTPLFSFIIARLFHQGIVASGIEARLFSVAGMSRAPSLGRLGEPVHDQPPAGAQQPVVLAEPGRAERVDRSMSTPSPPVIRIDLVLEVLVAVVDRVVDALGADRVVLGRRRGAEDLGAALRAIWVAEIPTPPAAAWISTRSPSRRPPIRTSAA